MELHQVRYFLALCRTLNFTRAAEACNVTQPALTRAIQRLEDELGGPLLYRERSLTQLTPLGRAMMPHLEATLRAAEMVTRVAGTVSRQTPVLRVGLVDGVSASLIAESLGELARRFPDLELSLHGGAQKPLIESLLLGETDAALLIDDGELADRLDRWKLLHEGCRAVFAPGHRFEQDTAVALPALAHETVVRGDGWGTMWVRFGCENSSAARRVVGAGAAHGRCRPRRRAAAAACRGVAVSGRPAGARGRRSARDRLGGGERADVSAGSGRVPETQSRQGVCRRDG